MGTLEIAFIAVAPLFLAIFAGFVFSRTKAASENWVDIYAIAVQYKLEAQLVSRIVVVSTLLAIVIIPIWMVWLE